MGLTLIPKPGELEKRKRNKKRLIRAFVIGLFFLAVAWVTYFFSDAPTWWAKILVIVSILWVLATYFAFRVVWNPRIK